MGEPELLIAGILSSCALIYSAPAALPERSLWSSVRSAFFTSLALACAFLLTDAVRMLADTLWGIVPSLLLCIFFSFIFSRAALWALLPEMHSDFFTASVAVLVLSQPAEAGWGDAVLSAVGTAAGVILFITALSPAAFRISLSDAPRCIRGLPSVLLISGIAALAFSGF